MSTKTTAKLNISFWAESELYNRLKELAHQKRITLSELLREITLNYTKKQGGEDESK